MAQTDGFSNKTRQYWADNFIRFLLEGKREITDAEIESRKKALGLSFCAPFVAVEIAPEYSSVKYAEKDFVFDGVESFVNKQLDALGASHVCLTNSYNNVMVLIGFDGAAAKPDELTEFFIALREKLFTKFSLPLFIGIGSVANDYKGIAVSASDAHEMLGFKYQYADSGVVNIATMVQFQYNISHSNNIEMDRVIGCFKDGNLGRMETRLLELVEVVRARPNVSGTSIRRSLVEVTVHLLHTASNAGVEVDAVLGDTDPYRYIMRQNHTEVITEWIMKLSATLLDCMKAKRESEENAIILQAKDFIENNLGRVELGLSQVSEAVGLSATYCSQLFKKEVGMGISTYITEKRVARAQRLLCETLLTSGEISKQTGFASPGYFGQVFRKVTGQTPQEYRRTALKN